MLRACYDVLIGTPDSGGGRISSPANWRRDVTCYVCVLVQILAWNLKREKVLLANFFEFLGFRVFSFNGVCKTSHTVAKFQLH